MIVEINVMFVYLNLSRLVFLLSQRVSQMVRWSIWVAMLYFKCNKLLSKIVSEYKPVKKLDVMGENG